MNLQPVSDAKMNDFWASGNFDAYIWYWSGDPDPNYQLSVFTSGQCGGWSDGCWKDPHYDALYEEQRGIMDRQKRLVVVQEAQRYLYDHIPGIVLAYPGWLQAYRNDRFTGWVPAPGNTATCSPATTTTPCFRCTSSRAPAPSAPRQGCRRGCGSRS